MSVKTAMIGLGIMGRRMAEHMSLHPEYQLSGLWDPNPEACEAAQALPPNAPIVSVVV
ncbi:MAG: NAD(P)-binding domain-containing protein [Paracoccaceae bacterium]|jgi:3-hydroxyisobutyrate dehydrogenase-like beta-hydroxyacid dehydrogenase|nr:NAD(P)-binding domain-containing protein [Paracoccaceae bacterium]MDG1370322.1 NAD(P)-binding domain-containing protein [Paracoccaceae bacterium]